MDPGVVECGVVEGHDGLDHVPVRRLGDDAETAICGGGSYVRMHKAEAVGGGERLGLEVRVGCRQDGCREAIEKIGVPVCTNGYAFNVNEDMVQ